MNKLKENKGAAAVEFAIILLPLILLVFGAIEFGVLMYNQQVITNASREGARAGIVASSPRLSEDDINRVVQNYASTNLITFGSANAPVTRISTPGGTSFGDDLIVYVEYWYSFLVIPNFIPGITNPRKLTATTVMRYE